MHRPPVSRIRRPEHEQNDRERAMQQAEEISASWWEVYAQGFWHGYVTGTKEKPDA